MAEDAKWPRANSLITKEASPVGIIDIPAYKTSISKTSANLTPLAIREALSRYSTYSYSIDAELKITLHDLGAIEEPDTNENDTVNRIASADKELVIALGGDNSVTYAAALGIFANQISTAGLITLDAHHDLRDGVSNGSPVRRLIEAGLDPARIVQIGINDFSNSPEYVALAKRLGITVISRGEIAENGILKACEQGLKIAGIAGGPIHVDLDVDVCDRSVVPACPAAAPGGISAFEIRQAARVLASDTRVKGLDITEIDAGNDSADQRTVRLGALLVLEALAGFQSR
jgi:formiminoglutamase